MKSLRLIITGEVQGVGYRMWLEREAESAAVDGWVRNRLDGSVECLLSGEDVAVEGVVARCRQGPRGARVASVGAEPADPPPRPGFFVLRTE